jgi:hypothetical protein
VRLTGAQKGPPRPVNIGFTAPAAHRTPTPDVLRSALGGCPATATENPGGPRGEG